MIKEKLIKDKLSVVLPTFNEFKNLSPLIDKILSYSNEYDLEIIVVDDNSTDNTLDLIRSLSKEDNRIRLIHRLDRIGLSSAIKEGLICANSNFLAVMDSDGHQEAVHRVARRFRRRRCKLLQGPPS